MRKTVIAVDEKPTVTPKRKIIHVVSKLVPKGTLYIVVLECYHYEEVKKAEAKAGKKLLCFRCSKHKPADVTKEEVDRWVKNDREFRDNL
jgi:hypothetical protein